LSCAAAHLLQPRAITLDHEALRVFQACGLADVMENSDPPHNGSHFSVSTRGDKNVRYCAAALSVGWFPNATFVHLNRRAALRDKLAG